MTLIKIVKRYTIKFSYAGIAQYAEFREMENGELWQPSFLPSYANVDPLPDVSKLTKIEDVLKVIKNFAYGNRAEIEKINGMPVFYYNKTKTRKLVSEIGTAYEQFLESQARIFFNVEIKPFLIKNKWKISKSHLGILIPIEKDKGGEWQNVSNKKKEYEFDYLCSVFLRTIGQGDSKFELSHFLNLLPTGEFEDLYIELP